MRQFIVSILLTIGYFSLVSTATAGVTVCNQSSEAAYISLSNGNVSQGWWVVHPSQCSLLVAEYMQPGSIVYFYAKNWSGGLEWVSSLGIDFCVAQSSFRLSRHQGCGYSYNMKRFTGHPVDMNGNAVITLQGVAEAMPGFPGLGHAAPDMSRAPALQDPLLNDVNRHLGETNQWLKNRIRDNPQLGDSNGQAKKSCSAQMSCDQLRQMVKRFSSLADQGVEWSKRSDTAINGGFVQQGIQAANAEIQCRTVMADKGCS